MASPRRSALLVALLVPVLAFAACGGDDDDTGSTSGTGTASGTSSEDATTTTAAAGKGTGTLSIAGTEFTFDAEPCSIGGDDDQPVIDAEGKGTADGKDFTVVVARSASKDSVLENFQLVFTATEAMIGTNFVSLPDGKDNAKVKVDDGKATGTLNFLGTGGRPSGEGTFTLTCEG